MLNRLKNFFRPKIRVAPAENIFPAEEGITYLAAGTNFTCSYCGGEDFYEGPSGGLSTNMICANADCRHKFNFTPAFNNRVEDLHSTW